MISVVIPAHNEESNIAPLVASISGVMTSSKLDFEIVIVDDNSTDNTGKISDDLARRHKKITVLHRRTPIRGMGAALKDGTRSAKGDIIIWVMGDRSDDISTLPKMAHKINEGFDVVFGSRYMEGGSRGDLSITKAILSKTYTAITKAIFGLKVNDITNAFRAFRKDVFNTITLESNDFAISPEFAIKAHKKGFRLCEVPVTYKNRTAGKTKFNIIKMGLKYGKLFSYKFSYK